MDFEETMVDVDEAVEDDAPFEGFAEESEDEEYEEEEYSDEYTEEPEAPDEEPEEEPQPEEEPPQTEPGWIKKRVQKAVDRAVAEALAQQQAKFDEQMAPIIAKMQEDEAQELVRSRKIADIETARDYVRMKNGQPQPPKQEAPRNEQGQFVSKEQIAAEAAVNARIKELKRQSEKIQEQRGINVIEVFQTNKDIRQQVINEEMDFYDVADMISKQKKKPPTPSRSPNGSANYTPNAFDSMSKSQFERFEKQLDRGVRYSMK